MDDLIESLLWVVKAKADHDEERAKCEHDWGYFGSHEIIRLEEAKREFEKQLNAAIDARLKAWMESRTPNA
jgi:hypothetical protein